MTVVAARILRSAAPRPGANRTLFSALVTVSGMAMGFAAHEARAASDVAGNGASARAALDFAISIPKVMQLRLLGHPAALDISAEDIARGEVTVSGPSLDLLVNDRFGYVLRAEIVNAIFTAVRITGLASPVVVTQDPALLRMPTMVGRAKPAPVPVEYKLQLAADTVPGRYPWPVSLTIQEP
jgi:hypothetical protein